MFINLMPEYLLILILIYIVALSLKYFYKVKVFRSVKESIVFYLIIMTLGISWDYFAIARGHWAYSGKGLLGFFVGIIPIEDFVFAAVTSYFVLVIYKILQSRK